MIVCSLFTQKADQPPHSRSRGLTLLPYFLQVNLPLIEISCFPRIEISGMFPSVFWKHAGGHRKQRRQPQVFHPPQADQCPGSWAPRIRCAHSMVFVASIISTHLPTAWPQGLVHRDPSGDLVGNLEQSQGSKHTCQMNKTTPTLLLPQRESQGGKTPC